MAPVTPNMENLWEARDTRIAHIRLDDFSTSQAKEMSWVISVGGLLADGSDKPIATNNIRSDKPRLKFLRGAWITHAKR